MSVLQTRQLVPSLAVEVLEAVAAREGVDATTLPPLADVVDPDALDALFAAAPERPSTGDLSVQFDYYGYSIRIGADRAITIE
jgi:hypothetical protein